jgi:hypothetical protein
MNRAIQQFAVNLQSAKQLGVVYLAFADKVTEAISLDELLRAEIVLALSAVDCYVHDVVRIGMSRLFFGVAQEPNAFLNGTISLGCAKRVHAAQPADRPALVEEEIRRLHGFRTFQSADNISQALALIGIQGIWEKVGGALAMPVADIRRQVDIIVDRRNRIAHEGDIDPTMGVGTKYQIDHAMVAQSVSLLERVTLAIHDVVLVEGPV